MPYEMLGDKLRQYRSAMNLTQTELGKLLGVSQVTIAHYEKGERFPKPNTLITISKLFDTPLDEILSAPGSSPINSTFSEQMQFDLFRFIEILRYESIETALAYTSSWKSSKNLDLLSLYEGVLSRALEYTGELWLKGEIYVSEEHLISEKIRELILIHGNREWERSSTVQNKKKRWMGFCAPGEKHYLGLLMLSQLLRISGWQTYYLGTQVPFQDLAAIIKKYNPHVLGVSISLSENREGMEMYVQKLHELFGKKTSIVLGGQGAPLDSQHKSPSVAGVAQTLREGVSLINSLG